MRSAPPVLNSVFFFGMAACPAAPRRPEPIPAFALDADVCKLTQDFSGVLQGDTNLGPTEVVLAHGDDGADLADAYDRPKTELERCIDPALRASFTPRAEVWPSRPPLGAVRN